MHAIRHASEGWHLVKQAEALAARDPGIRWGDGSGRGGRV